MKMVIAAVALVLLGATPAALADCGADHAAQSAAAEPARAPAADRDAKAHAARDQAVASRTVKQKVAKVKATTAEQQHKVAANTPK